MAYETFNDAIDKDGKLVHALELVKTWHYKRVCMLVLGAAILDFALVAVVSVATHDFETGLTAGSYAAAVEALALAMLALLSAVFE